MVGADDSLDEQREMERRTLEVVEWVQSLIQVLEVPEDEQHDDSYMGNHFGYSRPENPVLRRNKYGCLADVLGVDH